MEPKSLRQVREAEAREAVARLGASSEQVDFLHYPDGEASFHVTAIANDIAGVLKRHLPDSVFIPHASDFTADHAAVNAAARHALALHGRRISVYEYPIWFWYHWPWVRLTGHMSGLRRPVVLQSVKTACGLVASSALNRSAYVGDVLHRKRAALAAHVSQTQCGGDDDRWSTLHDLSEGDFVRRLLADYETFKQYEVNTCS